MTLATKYRPQKFSEVRGQHDMFFLTNVIKSGDPLPPAILFCGPSGVGKTTLARIVAKAVNCENRTGAEPCGECPSCASGAAWAVEVDASECSGAEDMRRLKESAYSANLNNHTIYILDEVQGISHQAWNVLLKLLEEPPDGVTFILLTSEPRKVPTKIRTRAIRIDFGLVPAEDIAAQLEAVCLAEGISVAIDPIIDLAEGSMREALTILEQASKLDGDGLVRLLGRDFAIELLLFAVDSNYVSGMALLRDAYERTGDLEGILTMWGQAMEKVLYVKHDIPCFLSKSRRDKIALIAENLTDEQWAAAMEILASWSRRVVSRAHLAYVWSLFLKAIHGSAYLANIEKKDRPADDLASFDEGEFAKFMTEL